MKKRMALILAIVLMAANIAPAQAAAPNTSIVAVVKNESVTIQTTGFPVNQTFHVLMGFNGSQGINGYLVSKITTGEGGSFLAKFYIPDELAGEEIVAVRFESVTESKYYTFNWFYNETATGVSNTTYTDTTNTSGPTYNNLPPGFPTFDILSVVKGSSVTVQTRYFPENQRFAVFMQDGASTATTLYEVAGIDTQEGNSFTVTLTIPYELHWQEKIKIIFYNINDGFRTYNLFYNRNQ
jgi:hypothetical protein